MGDIEFQAGPQCASPGSGTASFLVICALDALDRPLSSVVIGSCAVLLGALHGCLDGTAMAGGGGVLSLFGHHGRRVGRGHALGGAGRLARAAVGQGCR